jgi:RNA polymerase sigma factor (sigma-70 family)
MFIKDPPRFTAEEEQALIVRKCNGDKEARELLFLSCVPFALSLLRGPMLRSTRDDSAQEAFIGLLKAVDKVKPNKERVIAYSRKIIMHHLYRFWFSGRLIKVPRADTYQIGTEKLRKRVGRVFNVVPLPEDYDQSGPGDDNAHALREEIDKIIVVTSLRDMFYQHTNGSSATQIGKEHGISRDRVWQIVRRLREMLKSRLEPTILSS